MSNQNLWLVLEHHPIPDEARKAGLKLVDIYRDQGSDGTAGLKNLAKKLFIQK